MVPEPSAGPEDREAARIARLKAESYARNLISLLRMTARRRDVARAKELQDKLRTLGPEGRAIVERELEASTDEVLTRLLQDVLRSDPK